MKPYRLFGVILAFFVCLTGCERERPEDPSVVVEEMVKAGAVIGGKTAGRLYSADLLSMPSSELNPDAMSEAMVAAAFGQGSEAPDIFARFEAYAVWFCTFAWPVEYGCFIVSRERDAEETAQMCLQRADMIRKMCGEAVYAPPPLIMGRCVFYAVGEGGTLLFCKLRLADMTALIIRSIYFQGTQ